MKALVLSDIHGNLEALDAVLKDAEGREWKELWFLGDLCGYGPDPEACFKRLNQERLCFIPGNHDLTLCGRFKADFFNNESRMALVLSRSLVSKKTLDLINALPAEQTRKGIHLVHGSPEGPSDRYILNEDDAERSFVLTKKNCVLFGHSHRQECYVSEENRVSRIKPESGETVSWKKRRILINPGSVGQPRDRDPRAAWGIIATRKKEFRFFRTPYDPAPTQEKMERIGFSEFLRNRLNEGI
jgi:predicted phosphodiesterase